MAICAWIFCHNNEECWPLFEQRCIVMLTVIFAYIDTFIYRTKKERYIKCSLKLRIFHFNIVKECIVTYNHQCFMVDMSCRGDR